MRPTSITRTPAGDALAIVWEDKLSFTVPLTTLRDMCPCALCAGETLLLGKFVKPATPPKLPGHYELVALTPVGNYALGASWRDGHNTGLYTWEHLRTICEQTSRN